MEADRSGFLLRHCRAMVQDLEFDGVSGDVLPRSDSFNGNGSAFGRLPWRSTKLLDSDGAASSSGAEVICPVFLGWLLRCCWRRVTDVHVLLKGFFNQDCNFLFWLRIVFAKARVFLSF